MTYDVVIGFLYLGIPLLFVPLYLRIFISQQKYRLQGCYQLMIQIGIVQCVIGITYFLEGIPALAGFDPLGIGSFAVNVQSACFRIETGLSFLLALDRVHIVCDVKMPKYTIKILSALVVLYGIAEFIVFHTADASMFYSMKRFTTAYNYSYPLSLTVQKTGFYYTWTLSALTLFLYLIIVGFLIREKMRMAMVTSSFKQKWILIQAVIRFFSDVTLTFFFNIGPLFLSPSNWNTGGVIVGYIANHLLLPPLLYILLNGYVVEQMRRSYRKVFQRLAERNLGHGIEKFYSEGAVHILAASKYDQIVMRVVVPYPLTTC
uniref:7TM_GPCR_Srx domain-containing protein n=1 Tax=Steinernema glaseri TaxID=37863 RepID=A0A1I7ZCV6_9BILA